MTDFFRLYSFHFRQYLRNNYFLTLVLMSTSTILIFSYLQLYAMGRPLSSVELLRASVFGIWSSTVTASGALHFQRFQGTLSILLSSGKSELTAITSLLLVPATFGLLAFPTAYLLSGLLNGGHFIVMSPIVIPMLALFLISASLIGFFISCLFLLSENAFVYEELLVIPIMIISGLVTTQFFPKDLPVISWLLPISLPIHVLLNSHTQLSMVAFSLWLLSILCWSAAGGVLFLLVLRKAKTTGRLEVF